MSESGTTSGMSRRQVLGLLGAGVAGAAAAPLLGSTTAIENLLRGEVGGVAGAATKQGLRIAAIKPVTGSLAAAYAPLYTPLSLAISQINAQGGVLGQPVTQQAFDDQGLPSLEGAVARQLIAAGYTYAVGPIGSSNVATSLAVTQKNHVIQAGVSETPSQANPKKYPGQFQNELQDNTIAQFLVNYLVKTKGAKKIAWMAENTAYGQSGLVFAKHYLKGTGANIVDMEIYNQMSTTTLANVQRIKESGADALLLWATIPPDLINIFTSVENAGLKVPIGVSSTFATYLTKLLPSGAVSPEVLNNIRTVVKKTFSYAPGVPANAATVTYINKLFTTYPAPGELKFAIAQGSLFDFTHILAQAVNRAGTTAYGPVLNELQTMPVYHGVVGPVQFTKTNHIGLPEDAFVIAKVTGLSNPLSLGFLPERD
jgi:branched-chain amino acid transport system substrate-binding protein